MSFDPVFALNVALPLAEAAYDLTKLPPNWDLIATIEPAAFGFIAQSGGTVAVSFRGTQHEAEWLEDFDALIVPNAYGPGGVHRGFQQAYAKIRQSLRAVKPTLTYDRLLITGHSLGAALAVLAAADLFAHRNATPVEPECYTFAGPRVGWFDFAGWFDLHIPAFYRIVNHWDIVPHMPHEIVGYRHVGNQVLVNGGYIPDLHLTHSLAPSYRAGLLKLIGDKVKTAIMPVVFETPKPEEKP